MLAHLRLLPPRKLRGEQGVLDFVRHVNCIQNDPMNVVGQNADLVLQSRVRGYKPAMLAALLYKKHRLLDGVDKQMSIYPVEDWPYFAIHREDMGDNYARHESTVKAAKLLDWVRDEIRRRGPLSSVDLEDDTRIDWWLANKARAVRIAMDILFVRGETAVHHRVGTRRYFELSRRVLPSKLLKVRSPHTSQEDYLEPRGRVRRARRSNGDLRAGRTIAGPPRRTGQCDHGAHGRKRVPAFLRVGGGQRIALAAESVVIRE